MLVVLLEALTSWSHGGGGHDKTSGNYNMLVEVFQHLTHRKHSRGTDTI